MAYKAVKMQNTSPLEDIAYTEIHRYTPKKLSYDRAILKDPYSNSAFREIEMTYKESGRKMEPEYRKLVDILEGKTVEKEKYDSGYRERWNSRLAKFNAEMREIKSEGNYGLNRTQKRELEALLDNNYLKKSIRRTKDESRKASLRSFKSHAKRYVGEAYSWRKADYSNVDDVIEQYVGQKTAKKETAKPAEKTAAKRTAAKRKTAKTAYSGAETKADEQNYSLSLPELPEISDLTLSEEITREKNTSPKSVYVKPVTLYHAIPATTTGNKEKEESKKNVPLEVIAASAETGTKTGVKSRFSVRTGIAYAAMFLMLLGAGKSIATAAKAGKTIPKQKPAPMQEADIQNAAPQDSYVMDVDCEIKHGKGNPSCILGIEESPGESRLITSEDLEKKNAEKTSVDIYQTNGKNQDEQDKQPDIPNQDNSDKDKSDEGKSNYSKPGFHAAASADSAAPAATDTVKTDYNPNAKPKFHARPLEDTLNDRPRFHAKPAQENIPPQETPYPIQTQFSDDDGLPKVLGATVMPSLDITDSGQPVVGLDVSKKGTGVTVSTSLNSGYSEAIAHTNKIGVGMNTNNALIVEDYERNMRITAHDNRDHDVTVGKGIDGLGYVGATTNGTGYASLVDGIVKVTNSRGNIEIGVNPDLIILKTLGVNVNPGAIFNLDFKNLISLGLVEHEKTNDMYNQLVQDRQNRHEYAAQARYAWEKMIFNAWSDGSAKSFVKNIPVVGKIFKSFGGKNGAIKKEGKELMQSVDRLKNRTGSLYDLALAAYADVDLHGGMHEDSHTHTNSDKGFDSLGADIAKKVHSELEQILDGMKNDQTCRVDLDDGKIVFVTPESIDDENSGDKSNSGEKELITCGKAYGLISAAFAEDRKSTGNRTAPMDRMTLDELMAVQ